jgi:hypothetical protein
MYCLTLERDPKLGYPALKPGRNGIRQSKCFTSVGQEARESRHETCHGCTAVFLSTSGSTNFRDNTWWHKDKTHLIHESLEASVLIFGCFDWTKRARCNHSLLELNQLIDNELERLGRLDSVTTVALRKTPGKLTNGRPDYRVF